MQSYSFLLLIVFYQSNVQSSMTLQPYGNMGEDVMLWDLAPDSNLANDSEFRMVAWTWNSIPGIERTMLDFYLSLIPPNSTIIHADLSLYGNVGSTQTHSTINGSNECKIQRITSLWNPATEYTTHIRYNK